MRCTSKFFALSSTALAVGIASMPLRTAGSCSIRTRRSCWYSASTARINSSNVIGLDPQITVLDAGGQYCHLIARRVRDLGVYAEVAPSETPAGDRARRRGVIISGGPSSVYDPRSPTIDPRLLHSGTPVLGICYGQQLMAHLLGGRVEKGDRGEYGFAQLDLRPADTIFRGIEGRQQVW